MASLSAAEFSMDITRTGVKVIVPKHDLAFLMYYLRCVTVDVGLDILDDDLVNYENYGRLSNERRALVLQYARQLSPRELIDKIIFRDDQKVITRYLVNEFCDISVACSVASVQRDIFIAGKMQSVTKVMFYQQSWLDEHYNRPIERAAAQKQRTNPFFRGITHYLAPLLYLTALFLSVFVYLSPALMLHDQVALLTVTPTATMQPGPTNGSRLLLGALGSCSKENSTAQVQCTNPNLHPVYDLSVLPSSTPTLSIPSLVLKTPHFIAFSLGCALVFFVLYVLTAYRYKMGKAGQRFDNRTMQKLITYLGVLGILIGLGSFVSLRKWLGTSVQDFNGAIQAKYTGPQFVARIGNGFIILWVAYGFYSVAVFVALTKLATHGERCFWRT
jgi:hypothetical protein